MDQKTLDTLMSSGDGDGSSDWATPREFFDKLNAIFGPFDLDAAANGKNAKVVNYYSSRIDALQQPWIGRVFCNPPYGRGIDKWIAKGAAEAKISDASVVMLIPARTDTKWWHEIVMRQAHQIFFVKGRVKFRLPGQEHRNSATFPSAVIVFNKHGNKGNPIGVIDA